MNDSSSDRDRAQRLFEEWVARRARGEQRPAEDWVADENEVVQSEFLAIVEDYLALTEGRPSDSGIGLSSLPSPGRELGVGQARAVGGDDGAGLGAKLRDI